MKKSLIIRWIIILLVVVSWTWSIFPIKDKDYLVEFKKMAQDEVQKLEKKSLKLEKLCKIETFKKQMSAARKESDNAYQKFIADHQDVLLSDAYVAQMKIDEYQELWKRVDEIKKDEPKISGFKAIEIAAKGTADTYRISLGDYIKIPFQNKVSNKSVLRFVRIKSAGKLKLGLDLQGGTEFIIGFDAKKVPSGMEVTDVRDRILEILRNRVDVMGVTEPQLKSTGASTISVRMPSVDEADKTDIRNTIRQNAKLEFHLVAQNNDDLVKAYNTDRKGFVTPVDMIRSEIEEERNGEIFNETIFILKHPEHVKGEDVKKASPNVNEFGNWTIGLEFKSRGAAAFGEVTGANVGRRLAIVLDGKIYSAPNINEAINGGRAEISGSFTYEEANRLAGVIASGNLPVSIQIDSEFGTDPTLGADSVRSGALAGLLGLLIVILFMVWYYRMSGLIAVCALVVNTLLVFGSMAITKATITMPGLAGMILTIGMAVDANVLIFERIREELSKGKSIGNAISSGYDKVFSSIFDANLTTLITAFFLYKFGSGTVKGFAVTLSFGIIASMFTALFMTHAIFDFLTYKGVIKNLPMHTFKFLKDVNFNFLSKMKFAMWFSATLVVISLFTFIIKGHGLLGIDFAGGTQFSYACEGNMPNVEKIRTYLAGKGYENARVGYKRSQGGDRQLEVILTNMTEDPTMFSQKLDKAFPECKLDLKLTNTVGGNVGAKFRYSASLAALLSFIAVIIYLSFRFEFFYGVGAVVAVIHDVIISAGLFFLFNSGQLSLTVVAALMTIIGYSLNDTIVIFDRVREMHALNKDISFGELVNYSINQTLSRTLLTTITTLFVVVALLIFGGGVIFDFAIVMFYGMFIGTYSTIFIASAIVIYWHNKKELKKEELRHAGQNLAKKKITA